MFCEKGVLRNFAKFTGKHLCQSLFLDKVAWPASLLKKALSEVFFSEFCEISKNTVSYRTPLVAASNCHLYCNSKYYHSSSEAYLEPCQIFMIISAFLRK